MTFKSPYRLLAIVACSGFVYCTPGKRAQPGADAPAAGLFYSIGYHGEHRLNDPELGGIMDSLAYRIQTKDFDQLRRNSFDSIQVDTTVYSIDRFIGKCIPQLFDDKMLSLMQDTSNLSCKTIRIPWAHFSPAVIKRLDQRADSVLVKIISLNAHRMDSDRPVWIYFTFVKARTGYLLESIFSPSTKPCCQ